MSEEQNQNEVVKPSFTLDDIKTFASQNEDVQKWLQSEKDSHFSRSLETWKEKTLPQLLDEEVKKRYPEETEEQRQLRELKSQFDQLQQEKQKETIKNQAYKDATEKGLPLALLDFFVGGDLESTQANLTTLETVWNEALKSAVGETFKQNGREPHKNTQSSQQINNPFKPETFNLTEQTRLYKENPELAQQLKKQAGN